MNGLGGEDLSFRSFREEKKYNLDACADHYVLISIVKSIDFAYLNPSNEIRKNSKIPSKKDEPK